MRTPVEVLDFDESHEEWRRQLCAEYGLEYNPDDFAPIKAKQIAWSRKEDEACEAGTVGCAVLHRADDPEPCEVW
jgi:hypothetical protein